MAFDPLEERRKGRRGMLDLFDSSPLSRGGMLSAAGMPPIQRARPAWAQTMYDANPPPVDYGSPEYWAMPSAERPTFFGTQNIYSPPTPATGMLDPIPQQQSEAWWAAQPRPSFVPADWVYIGMGDWGPPSDQPAGGLRLPPTGEAMPLPVVPYNSTPSDAS